MLTALILLQLTIVLALIFIGARVGGFGLGILVGGRGIELKSTCALDTCSGTNAHLATYSGVLQ